MAERNSSSEEWLAYFTEQVALLHSAKHWNCEIVIPCLRTVCFVQCGVRTIIGTITNTYFDAVVHSNLASLQCTNGKYPSTVYWGQ